MMTEKQRNSLARRIEGAREIIRDKYAQIDRWLQLLIDDEQSRDVNTVSPVMTVRVPVTKKRRKKEVAEFFLADNLAGGKRNTIGAGTVARRFDLKPVPKTRAAKKEAA